MAGDGSKERPNGEAKMPNGEAKRPGGLIELDGIGVKFGSHQVLEDLTGTFSGRCIGLLGPNGAGKTTLIHTLLGFFKPSAGTGRILGYDIQKEGKAIRHHVGYMPERDAFIAGMSGVRFVRLMAELSGLPARQALERAHEVFFYVGLGEARYRKLETYSLGMKQLVKLAQAVVHGPSVLFLDEPSAGLDPITSVKLDQLILRLARNLGVTFENKGLRARAVIERTTKR